MFTIGVLKIMLTLQLWEQFIHKTYSISSRWFTGLSQPVRRRVQHTEQRATVTFKARTQILRGIEDASQLMLT
jgi:hypothetical protein